MNITARNVNDALPTAVALFKSGQGVRRIAPRDPTKTTLEAAYPVATTYLRPQERVLFHPTRDANPFFHLFESLWILAGRADVQFLGHFLPRIKDYSDDGKMFHGAYGNRMRNVPDETGFFNRTLDQVRNVLIELHNDRNSRRAVIGLWQPELDSGYTGKDMPCNTTVYFKIREGALHMTVCNRSNDMVWGAYGANVVQFSMLQEYLAGMLDASIGRYTQFSDSFHVYENEPAWQRCRDAGYALAGMDPYTDGYVASQYGFHEERPLVPYQMVKDPGAWDLNLEQCMERLELAVRFGGPIEDSPDYPNPFFHEVVLPLFNAYYYYKRGEHGTALKWALVCAAEDWGLAAAMWLHRREQKAKEVAA